MAQFARSPVPCHRLQEVSMWPQECHLCKRPAHCHLGAGLCSDTCQASGCHTPGPAEGLAATSSCLLAGPCLRLSYDLIDSSRLIGSTEEGRILSLVPASSSRLLNLLLGSREGCKGEKSNNALCPGDLESFVHDTAWKLRFITWGFNSEWSTQIISSKWPFWKLHWKLPLSPWKCKFSPWEPPMINEPEFRFHLVLGLPGFRRQTFSWNAISLVLRLIRSLIKNVSFDRIQFETCTSKGSCTEPSRRILVRTQHHCEDRLSLALRPAMMQAFCFHSGCWAPFWGLGKDPASLRLSHLPPLCLRTWRGPDSEGEALAAVAT